MPHTDTTYNPHSTHGNLAQQTVYSVNNNVPASQNMRALFWDEDDRLNLVLDNSHFSYYLYGYDGQRVAKLTGSAFTLGTGFATNAMLDNYTLYPSEYLVITQQGYTKYYYAGGTRIASKLGSGGFEKMTRLCTLDQNLTANANILFSSVVANIGTAMPDYHISDPCPNYYPDIAGFRVQLPTLNFDPNFGITAQQNILQAFRQNYANEETYYFHGNHLGSANWVTLQNASPTQFLLHLPYGEEFVKQLSGSYDERFTFTGKEKDLETGYYYFGARFDNVDLGFMSVDPMADKYPSMSPYAYCAWNPVKLVDPSGEDFEKIIDHEKKTITIQAQFYVSGTATEEQERFFQKALDAWNSCSAVVSIPIGETGETEDYTICFNLINNKEKVVAPVNSVTFFPDNIFVKNFPKNPDAGGGTPSGNRIYMRNSSINNQLLAHEIGHCLGMTDHGITEYGLMFGTNSNLGNVRVASLGCVELGRLLYSCGFNFKGLEKKTDERIGRCVNTITYGNAPIGFENAVLSDRNIIKTDTKKFIR